MPSSPNYKRDYKQEYATAKARNERGTGSDSDQAGRQRLRRKALRLGMVSPGQDLDHIKPVSKGGKHTLSNARATTPSQNRSFARNSDGSMK